MRRILFVGIAALAVISTAAEALDGCGRGWYYNGRRCVPQDEPGYGPTPKVLRGRRHVTPSRPHVTTSRPGRSCGLISAGETRRDTPPPNPAFKTWNNCPPNFTVQDGVCKPYRGR